MDRVVVSARSARGDSHGLLCGVDGSAPACRATETAARWAVRLGASLTFLAVTREAPPDPGVEAYRRAEGMTHEPVLLPTSDAAACLDAAMRVAAAAGHSGTRSLVRAGPVARTLIGVAHEIGADTIVLGRQERSAIRRTVLGSVWLEIANRTDRTLVVVS